MQETDSEKQRERDRRDMAEELNGGNAGQVQRFLPDHLSPQALEKKKEEKYRSMSLHAMLLGTTAYEKLYRETFDMLEKFQKAAEIAMTEAEELLKQHDIEFKNRLLTAGRLSNGKLVFKNENDDVVDKQGNLIEDQAEIDGIVWRDDVMTFEEYRAFEDRKLADHDRIHAIRVYQTETLGNARNELESDDKPDAEKLRDIQDEIIHAAPSAIREKMAIEQESISFSAKSRPEYVNMPKL